jgi:2-iminoacetate synthase
MIAGEIGRRSRQDVERALASRSPGLDDLLSLLAPAAAQFLEAMAQRAHRLTVQRFGRVMGMFAPLYLSNVCTNQCVYCGFNAANVVNRVTLTPEEAERKGRRYAGWGSNVLLLSGEAPRLSPGSISDGSWRSSARTFTSIGIEMFPCRSSSTGSSSARGGQPDRLPGDV